MALNIKAKIINLKENLCEHRLGKVVFYVFVFLAKDTFLKVQFRINQN